MPSQLLLGWFISCCHLIRRVIVLLPVVLFHSVCCYSGVDGVLFSAWSRARAMSGGHRVDV